MWRGLVGKSFTPQAFGDFVDHVAFGLWRPKFITVHNTSAPDLKIWNGWQQRHPPITDEKWARNLEGYYRDQRHWSAGPHAFVTPHGILAFTPLNGPGVHTPSWNSISWGIETVGEFEHEPFDGAIRDNLVACLAILHSKAGLTPLPYQLGQHGLHFHKEDARTTHRTCPGRNMIKPELVRLVEEKMLALHPGEHKPGEAIAAVQS